MNLYEMRSPLRGLDSPVFTREEFFATDQRLALASQWAATSVNAAAGYPKPEWATAGDADRPCYMFQTASAAAAVTDGTQLQYAVAGVKLGMSSPTARTGGLNYRPQFRLMGTFFAEKWDVADFVFGMAVVDTSLIASEATDFIGIKKYVADTSFYARGRKASGAAVQKQIPPVTALGSNQFYTFDMTFVRQGVGYGNIEIVIGCNTAPGKPHTEYNSNVAFLSAEVAFPDTVLLTPSIGWRVGTAASQPKFGICYVGWEGLR